MQAEITRRQYDQVIAQHYDRDVQDVLSRSQEQAFAQLAALEILGDRESIAPVLDVGLGTGKFLTRLIDATASEVVPFGLDLSAKMVEIAQRRIPDLRAAVDDAANLRNHFGAQRFRVICTHFVTGFVPIERLAPQIMEKLEPGGCWSFVGGTQAAFPELQRRARSWSGGFLPGARNLKVDHVVCNPADHERAAEEIAGCGFEILAACDFQPAVRFGDFDEFMDFAYHGGWLTPFVERLGLHRAGKLKRTLLNCVFFPVADHHDVSVILARKPRQALPQASRS